MFQLPPGPSSIAAAAAAAAQRSPRQPGSPEGLRRGPRLPRQLRRAPPLSSHRPRPEAVRQCVVSMVAADSEGPEDRSVRRDRLEGGGGGGFAGVTSDLGVDLQVTRLWEEGLEGLFCLFSWGVRDQVFPSPFFLWDSLVAAILNLGALSGFVGSSPPCDCSPSLSSWNPSIKGLS